MLPEQTTQAIQHCLDDLANLKGDSPAEPVIRALVARSAQRLQLLCAGLLHRSYRRLTQPPVNLETGEMLSAVVERLLKAMREIRPQTVRQFFALANKHMRWELNDVARRLDERTQRLGLREELIPSPASSGSVLSPNARSILEAIESLPEEDREVFDLVRIQGMSQSEVAELIGASVRTVQRRLASSILTLTERLRDIRPVD